MWRGVLEAPGETQVGWQRGRKPGASRTDAGGETSFIVKSRRHRGLSLSPHNPSARSSFFPLWMRDPLSLRFLARSSCSSSFFVSSISPRNYIRNTRKPKIRADEKGRCRRYFFSANFIPTKKINVHGNVETEAS